MTKMRRQQLSTVVRMARKALARGNCKSAELWINRTRALPRTHKRLRTRLDRCYVAKVSRR